MTDDLARLDSLLNRVGNDYGVVFWLLIVVLGGTIQAIATYANQTFEDALPPIFAQLAARTDDMPEADLARRALTAWTTGDNDLVTRLGFDEEIERVGPKLVLVQFVGMLGIISRSFAHQAGFSISEIREGWSMALGTVDGES